MPHLRRKPSAGEVGMLAVLRPPFGARELAECSRLINLPGQYSEEAGCSGR